MSTLNVANISDDQSTLSNSDNPSDVLNNTTTVDTKFVTNGCAKAWFCGDQQIPSISLNISTSTDHGTGDYSYSLTSSLTTVGATTTSPRRNGDGQVTCQNENRDSSSVVAIRHYDINSSPTDGRNVHATFGELA
jgi:hypothetical protein